MAYAATAIKNKITAEQPVIKQPLKAYLGDITSSGILSYKRLSITAPNLWVISAISPIPLTA